MTTWIHRGMMTLLIAIGANGLTGACEDSGAKTGRVVGFLEDCTAGCSAGLECLCGVCTIACTSDTDCSPLLSGATCNETAGVSGSCPASTPNKACDFLCRTDADCSELATGTRCASGRCRAAGAADASLGTGDSGSGGAGPNGGGGAAGTGVSGARSAAGGRDGGRSTEGGPSAGGAPVVSGPDGSVETGGTTGAPQDAATGDSGVLGVPAGANCPFCPTGSKICGGLCVSVTDPHYGCGCQPECSFPHAVPGCSSGECTIAACTPRRADCNGNPSDGCEADLGAAATCGSCNTPCGTGQKCTSNGCAGACTFPQTDCGDGSCRDLSSDPNSCGSCSKSCANGLVCSSGTCVCGPGTVSSGGSCIDPNTSSSTCGPSGTFCKYALPPAEDTESCVNGSCVLTCRLGFAQCGSSCVALESDVANCGQCGHACTSGQICAGGSCMLPSALRLVTGLGQPEDLVVDDTTLYWTDIGDNTVHSVPKAGGTPTLLASGQAKPVRIAVDADYVYWSSQLGGGILRAAKGVTDSPTLVVSAVSPKGLVVDKTHVYWTNSGDGQVRSVPRAGGAVTVLASGAGEELATDGTSLYTLGPLQPAQGMFLQIGKTGGTTSSSYIATRPLPPLVSTGSTIFFTTTSTGGTHVWESFARNPSPDLLFALGLTSALRATNIAADDCTIYGSAGTSIWLMRIGHYSTPDGPALVASTQAAGRMVVDDTYLYWVDTGFIGRVHK